MAAPRYEVYLGPSRAKGKKMAAVVFQNGRKVKTVNFGAAGMSDYTIHRDPERMERYLTRHRAREDWSASGVLTPGFWSRWILWSEPSLPAAIRKTSQKFHLKIRQTPPPG
jgi:hypothetical protein